MTDAENELKTITAERDRLADFARFAMQYDEPTFSPKSPDGDDVAGWVCHSCTATVDTEDDSHVPDMEHQDDCLWLRALQALNPEE